MSNRKLIIVPVLILVVLGGGAAYWWYGREAPRDTGKLTLYGNVDTREVQLAFQVSGRVSRMLVSAGAKVEPGQPLAELDDQRLRDGVALARAQVEQAAQRLAALEAGSRPQEIQRARAEVDGAAAAASSSAANYHRLQGLAKEQFVSPQTLEDARAAAHGAEARLRAAKQSLALAVSGPRAEDIAAAKAGVAAARAQLSISNRDLEDATLKAPSVGVVRDRVLEPGDMASPQRPAYTLALNDPMWVRAYVPEPDLGRIRPGLKAVVTTDSFPGKRYNGWIGYISPTAEFTPQTVETTEVRTDLVYEVRVYVCNPQGELRLGMPATVAIPIGERAAGIASGSDECGGASR